MKFFLTVAPNPDSNGVDIFAVLETDCGTRTRWTCAGLSHGFPVSSPQGLWIPVGYEECDSQPEPLLPLTREEALALANAIYDATGTNHRVTEPHETGDTWDEAPKPTESEALLFEFLSGFDEIILKRRQWS